MEILESIESVSEVVRKWKHQRFRIAFVPTMGNLHAGHISLIKKAQNIADKVVVSIYVNPMQFSEGEDFVDYPRTLNTDCEALVDVGVDLLFLPTNQSIYQASTEKTTQVFVPEISEILCGANRPKHFLGVTTIVNKLFNIVQPDVAIFGQKDYQQVAIIRLMVADLFMPVEIVALETVRENDGLAMSSRNQYLSKTERITAAKMNEIISEMSDLVINGAEIAETEHMGMQALKKAGFSPEYFSFRDPLSLSPAKQNQAKLLLVVAANLGRTRLIDNQLFSLRNTA